MSGIKMESILSVTEQIQKAVLEKLGDDARPNTIEREVDMAIAVYNTTLVAAEIRRLGMAIVGATVAGNDDDSGLMLPPGARGS